MCVHDVCVWVRVHTGLEHMQKPEDNFQSQFSPFTGCSRKQAHTARLVQKTLSSNEPPSSLATRFQ